MYQETERKTTILPARQTQKGVPRRWMIQNEQFAISNVPEFGAFRIFFIIVPLPRILINVFSDFIRDTNVSPRICIDE